MDAEKMMMQKRIDNLCERLEKVERERDALRYDMQLLTLTNMCEICKFNKPDDEVCEREMVHCFAWRGLCYENGGAEDEG